MLTHGFSQLPRARQRDSAVASVSRGDSQFGQPGAVFLEPFGFVAGLGNEQPGLQDICMIDFGQRAPTVFGWLPIVEVVVLQ